MAPCDRAADDSRRRGRPGQPCVVVQDRSWSWQAPVHRARVAGRPPPRGHYGPYSAAASNHPTKHQCQPILYKQESLALASMAKDDSLASSTAAAMRDKVGSEFET